MPLTRILVKKGLADDPEGYGNKTGEGCTASYYEFYLNVNNPGTYKPAVQVLDNWGWCNGLCKDNGNNYGINGMPNGGCYNESPLNGCEKDGSDDSKNPWVQYGGNVIVK